jgi:hypothetical protein
VEKRAGFGTGRDGRGRVGSTKAGTNAGFRRGLWRGATRLVLFGSMLSIASCSSDGETTDEQNLKNIYGPPAGASQIPVVIINEDERQDLVVPIELNAERTTQVDGSGNPLLKDEVHSGYSWLRAYGSQAVALMFGDPSDLDESDPNDVRFPNGGPLGERSLFVDVNKNKQEDANERFKLCPDQLFVKDFSAGLACSATLIDDDLVLTAAHCVENIAPTALRFAFNYYSARQFDTVPARPVIRSVDIFRAASSNPIVAQRKEFGLDFAIVRLDRKATPRFQPVPVRAPSPAGSSKPFLEKAPTPVAAGQPAGTSVQVGSVGSPFGTPFKINTSHVTSFSDPGSSNPLSGEGSFTTRLDMFGGNSGAGIFDLRSFELVGSHISSATDFEVRGKEFDLQNITNSTESCVAPRYCDPIDCLESNENNVGPALQDLCFNVNVDVAGRRTVTGERLDASGKSFSPRLCKDVNANNTCSAAFELPVSVQIPVLEEGNGESQLKHGAEIIVSGNTSTNTNRPHVSGCGQSGDQSKAAYYKFTLTEPSMVYADTFNSTFDTVLYIGQGCGGGGDVTTELGCNDDNSASIDNTGIAVRCVSPIEEAAPPALPRTSQLRQRLAAGSYILAVSGFRGASGRFQLHFQTLADSKRSGVSDAIGRGSINLTASTSGTLSNIGTNQVELGCTLPGADGGRDLGFFAMTCPNFRGGGGFLSTCNSDTAWDSSLAYAQGNQLTPDVACNDDSPSIPSCLRQSTLNLLATTGSGLRAVYVDGWRKDSHGFFRLTGFVP